MTNCHNCSNRLIILKFSGLRLLLILLIFDYEFREYQCNITYFVFIILNVNQIHHNANTVDVCMWRKTRFKHTFTLHSCERIYSTAAFAICVKGQICQQMAMEFLSCLLCKCTSRTKAKHTRIRYVTMRV